MKIFYRFFRQGQAEVVSNSKNKILATWEQFFCRALYVEDPLESVVVDHNDFVAVAATATTAAAAVISKNSFPFAN